MSSDMGSHDRRTPQVGTRLHRVLSRLQAPADEAAAILADDEDPD